MDVTRLDGRSVLVTGAASGIGRASALAFARRGASLLICDVDEAGLAETAEQLSAAGSKVLARRVDVASADEMRAFAEVVHAEVEAVDILMNNAGVGLGASFLDTTLEDWRWIVGINEMGVIHGCHFFLPKMVERGRGGHVVNVSSAAGYTPTPMMPAYVATKYAVLGLSESLRDELAPHRIGVTAVCPGIIDTPITRNARLRGQADPEGMRAKMVEGYQRRGYGPERVAENVLKAIQTNRLVAPIALESWILYYGKRLSPPLVRAIGRWLQQRAES